MRIAFTTSGETLDAALDGRFGRARRFVVYEDTTGAVEVLDNRVAMDSAQGAGIQAAQTIARALVQAVVTGHCGPKAFRVLSAAGIAVYMHTDGHIVPIIRDLIECGVNVLNPQIRANGLENLARCDIHSADHILPEFQHPQVGELVRLGPKGYPCFAIVLVDPGRALVLVSALFWALHVSLVGKAA